MRALVPFAGAIPLLGDLPTTVRVEAWDGTDAPPGGGRGVSFWAPAPWFAGPYDEGTGTWAGALAELPDLQVLQLLTSGYENALPWVGADVTVCNAHGVHDATVAEWVVGLLLATYRHVPAHVSARHHEETYRAPSEDLAGKRILIYGYGAVGAAVEERLAPFGVEILRVARQPRPGVHDQVGIRPLLGTVDAVIILLPLTEDTRHHVGRDLLACLKDGCVVMNPSRGPVVDLAALLDELDSGRLRAVLDVTEPQPLPAGHRAFRVENLVLTSRSAGRSEGLWSRVLPLVGDQLRQLCAGRAPDHVVRPARGRRMSVGKS